MRRKENAKSDAKNGQNQHKSRQGANVRQRGMKSRRFEEILPFDLIANAENENQLPPKTDETLKKYYSLWLFLKNYQQTNFQINSKTNSKEDNTSQMDSKEFQNEKKTQDKTPRISNKNEENIKNKIVHPIQNEEIHKEKRETDQSENTGQNNIDQEHIEAFQNEENHKVKRKTGESQISNRNQNDQMNIEEFQNGNKFHDEKREMNNRERAKEKIIKIQYKDEGFGIRSVEFVEHFF